MFNADTPVTLAAQIAAPVSTAAACSGSDPYQMVAALRTACDIQAAPLLSVTTRTDGGHDYHYKVGEVEVTLPFPPASFDAATTSQSEREAYGIPPEPSSTEESAHSLWEQMIHNYHVVTPPDALYAPGSPTAAVNSGSRETPNWSGYVDTGAKGSYNATGIIYDEPSTVAGCTSATATFWTGLAGYESVTPLDQAGTAIGDDYGLAEHQAWFEIYPDETEIAMPLEATPGYPFEVLVTHGSGNEVTSTLYNLHTGAAVYPRGVSKETYSGASAEYVAERPEANGKYTLLSDFGQWNVIEAWANGNHTLGPWDFASFALNMYEGTTRLAGTSALSAPETGQEFAVNWHAYNEKGAKCPDPTRNFFYHNSDGGLSDWYTTSHWQNDDVGGSLQAGTSPSAIVESGTPNVFYVGSDGAVWDWYVENGAWTDHRLGGSVKSRTSPSAVDAYGSGRNVFYVGSDGAVWDWYLENGSWTDYRLGGSVREGTSPSAVAEPSGTRNLFYVGSEGAVWDWYVENGVWSDYHLGGSVKSGTSPSGVDETGYGGSGRNLFYVGSDGGMFDWYVESGAWKDYRLGGAVKSGTSPSGIVEYGTGRNLFYVGSEGAISDWYVENGSWKNYHLGGAVENGTSPSAITESTSGRNVAYVGSEGAISDWYVENGVWKDDLLGGSVEAGTSPSGVVE